MSSNVRDSDLFCILPQPSQKSTFGNSSNELRTKAHVLLPNAPFLLFSILSPHLRRLRAKRCPILYIALSPRCSLIRLYCRLYTLYVTLPYLLCLGLCSVFAAALSKLCSSLLSCQILSQAIFKLSIVLECVPFEFAQRLEQLPVQRPVRIVQDGPEARSRLLKQ